MIKRLASVMLATAMIAGLAQVTTAQECAVAPAILSLSKTVLNKREALPPLPRRRFGAEAAYLALRYGEDDDATVTTILHLIEQRALGANDLAYALFVTDYGIEASLADVGDTLLELAATGGGISTARALLLNGGAALLFDTIAKSAPPLQPSAYRTAVVAIIDQPDKTKEALAKLAVDKTLPLLAAGLVASERDAAAWGRFAATLDTKTLQTAIALWNWLPAVVGNPSLPKDPPPVDPALSAKLYQLSIIIAYEPQLDFLGTLLNMSGRIDEVAVAGHAVGTALDSGDIAIEGTLDPVWILAYRALIDAGYAEEDLRQVLGSVDAIPRPGRKTILDTIEWIAAVEALGPFVRGETATPPEAPTGLDESWPQWIAAANEIRDGGQPNVADDMLPRLADLMLAHGDVNALALAISLAQPTPTLLRVADDLAVRLDRQCESYLHHLGEAMLIPGTPIFKFE